MWNVYYHFFITSADFELIQEHAWHLLQHAGTTRTWHNSPYGTLIRMCSENTLFDIRSVWQHYAENKHMRVHEEQGLAFKQGMTKVFQARIGPIATYASAVRCAGIHAFESQQVLDTAFKAYWKTGVIAGNRTDKLNLQNDQGGFANPLFAWSSAPDAGFAVHYGTDCVAGFHLAPAFDCQTSADQMLNSLMHISGVSDQPQYTADPRTLTTGFGTLRRTEGEPGLPGRVQVRGIVSLVLVVPRSRLRVFTKESALETDTPGLHVSVYNDTEFENSFHSIDAMSGRLQIYTISRELVLEKDSLLWRGDAGLIVNCFEPTFPFLIGPRNATRVALVVNSSLLNQKYTMQLELHLRVHDAGLDDGDLYLLEKPLGLANHDTDTRYLSHNPDIPPIEGAIVIKGLDTDKNASLTITLRCNGEEADVLSKGAHIQVFQQSLCPMGLFIGEIERVLEYPYLINKVTVHQSRETASFYQMPMLQNSSVNYLADFWELSVLDPDQQPAIAPGSPFPQLAALLIA
ncbi:hypothetical protein KVT40_001996 [Elsinoe batatas]|uniref:Uncharacterized protein n=1 Tax=Elsinoe batatas TaxID=2601811 RepID=A0A8K0PJC0_9PEZI|nr:hypothetical protein KVT40_001996 [Elsinoe batatas]